MNNKVLYGVLAVIVLALLAWGAISYMDRNSLDENADVVGEENSQVSGGCFIGGCSNQICSDQEGMVSTCEFREEYACYQSAKCERQADGECGWTQSPTLIACLSAKTDMQVELGK